MAVKELNWIQKKMLLNHVEEMNEWLRIPEDENEARKVVIENLQDVVDVIVKDVEWYLIIKRQLDDAGIEFIPKEYSMFGINDIIMINNNIEAFRCTINEYLRRMFNSSSLAFVHSIQPIIFRDENKRETGKGLKVKMVLNFTDI